LIDERLRCQRQQLWKILAREVVCMKHIFVGLAALAALLMLAGGCRKKYVPPEPVANQAASSVILTEQGGFPWIS